VNTEFKKMCVILALLTEGQEGLDDLLMTAMDQAGTPISRSKLQGWRVSKQHKNFRVMHRDDFVAVLDALIAYFDTDTTL
jgi:hypothetical protein